MENKDLLFEFFNQVIEGLKEDATQKNQKIPVSSFRHEETNDSGQLYAADYFQYLITGRGPGKAPPPDKMLDFVQDNPQVLISLKQLFKHITEEGAAYVIGQKIAREGTDIYSGKKPGIDFLGVVDKNMPELLKQLVRNEAVKFTTELQSALK